jgi:hypothetical protein
LSTPVIWARCGASLVAAASWARQALLARSTSILTRFTLRKGTPCGNLWLPRRPILFAYCWGPPLQGIVQRVPGRAQTA